MVTVLLFRLLPVQILIAAVGTVNSIVSGLFAGNFVGEAAMSAIALYGPIRLLMGALSVLLFGGSTILCGRYLGRNQQEKIQSLFSLDIFLAAASGTVFCLVMIVISSSDLSAFLIQDDSVRVVFNQYLLGQAVGVLPFFLGRLLSVFLTMRNQINQTTIASLIMIAVNALLNLLFVAVLHWGAFGSALAFSLGNWAFFAVQALYLLRGKDALHFALRRVSWPDCGQIIKIGLPGAASTIYQSVLGIIVNGLITAYVGSAGLSAYAASDSVLSFFWSIPAGMLAVSRMLLSISIGEEDRQTLTNVMRNMFRCFVPLMCAVSVVIILLAEPLTQQFYRNPSAPVYMMTVRAFQILPLSMPLSVICMHFVCYGQVSDKQALIHILSVLDGVICIAVFSALLIPTLGMNGVYIANVLNGVVTLLTVIVYSVLKNRRIPRNTEELMVIPDSFGVSEDDRMDLTVRSMDEVVLVSERVQQFCLEKGLDARRSALAGLAMEEMAGNVVRHGFQADKKKHSVDIRVVYKNNGVLLRIKDDCKPFDPGEWKKVTAPSDPASNIGIRLVFQIAESVEYQSVLGLNVLSIRI
jgi:Na+-driven multidrug efflux pump/anti-sigma regulatory factor (Ser/Thr protein kinase)